MPKIASKLFTVIALGLILVIGIFMLVACAPAGKSTITVIGSTSVGPLGKILSDAFTVIHKDIKIESQEIGSTQGIQAIIAGTADIGTSSRELKAEEKPGLTETIIAYDGIVVIVHSANKVVDLTSDQIVKIFKGEIKNWKEVGGIDKAITVINREAGSGTRGAFEELMKLQEKSADGKTTKSLITEKALIMDSTGALKTTVAGNEAAIGYISLGSMDNTVIAAKVDGVEATDANVKAKIYKIFRPFLMLTKGEMKPPIKAYIDFIMSTEGQRLVTDTKYISVLK